MRGLAYRMGLVLDRNIAVRALAVSAIYTQRASLLQAVGNLVFLIGGPKFGNPADANLAASIVGG